MSQVNGRKITRADFNSLAASVAATASTLAALPSGHVTPQQFGAVGDGVADDTDAFRSALDFLDGNVAGYSGANRLYIPKGTYKLTGALNIRASMIIEGAGRYTSVLKWVHGSSGIRVARVNTDDSTEGAAPIWTVGGGDETIIRHLTLQGGFSGTEGPYHGVEMRGKAYLFDVMIRDWSGCGVYSNTTAGAGAVAEGNANLAFMQLVACANNRHGMLVDGADTNVWAVNACDFRGNRQWGVLDSSFLGNSYWSCHTAGNGWDGAISSVPTACTYNGNRYACRYGQEAWCSTNAPTGTTANNQGWFYMGVGGTYHGIVAWVSGTAFRSGGAFYSEGGNARNSFLACYSESDQNASRILSPSIVIGGLHAAGIDGVVAFDSSGSFEVVNSGPAYGDSRDGALYINNTGSRGTVEFRSWSGSAPTTQAEIFATNGPSGGWIYYDAHAGIHIFRNNGAQVGRIDTNGLQIGSTKVIGAQGAAVADATDAASAITQLNALLARMRAHGLIAT